MFALLDIVHPILFGLYPLPARGQPLLLKGVAPVGGLGVVVYVILPASHRPVHRPTQREWQVRLIHETRS